MMMQVVLALLEIWVVVYVPIVCDATGVLVETGWRCSQ